MDGERQRDLVIGGYWKSAGWGATGGMRALCLLVLLGGCYRSHGLQSEEPEMPVEAVPVALSAGLEHTCAVLAGGRLDCWGEDMPREVIQETGVVAVSAGRGTCWLDELGGVECAAFGFSGDGFDGLSASSISAGTALTCLLARDGTIACYAWDACARGGCTPVQPFDGRYVAVAAGRDHVCALSAAGEVWCSGENLSGQVSGAPTERVTTARRVEGLPPAQEIAAGNEHTCARTGGAVWCWGRNAEGQLGDGIEEHGERCMDPRTRDTYDCAPRPVRVSDLDDAAEVDVGTFHSCARRSDGRAACWGSNAFGRLGDDVSDHGRTCGEADCSLVPVEVAVLENAASLAVGYAHGCALTVDSEVLCWGANLRGQLGDGTRVSRARPVVLP